MTNLDWFLLSGSLACLVIVYQCVRNVYMLINYRDEDLKGFFILRRKGKNND